MRIDYWAVYENEKVYHIINLMVNSVLPIVNSKSGISRLLC